MTIIGEAFIAISPESAGFVSKLRSQLGASDLGEVIGKLTAVGAAVGFAGALIASGLEFQKVTQQIQKETGATGDALSNLAETTKSVFTDVPASLRDTTTAVDELFRRGIPLGTLLDTLSKQEIFLAKITGTDLATDVESTTALFAKFNIPIAQQSRELDVLFKASQQSGKGLDALVTPLTTGAAALIQFGFSLDKSTALVASLEKAGVNVAPALAALRLAFGKIAQAGKDPQTVLAGLIKELTDGQNPAKGMADAIKLFGTRSGVELATAIKAGRFQTADLLKLITDGKGGIIATGEATLSLGQRFSILKNQIGAALEPLGLGTINAFEAITKRVGPDLVALFGSVTHVVVALGPILLPLGALLLGVFTVAGGAVKNFATGLDFLASILDHVAPVIRIFGGGLALLALALGLAYAAVLAFNLGIIAMPGPIQVAILAVAAIGATLNLFSDHSFNAAKAAKSTADSFSDASGIFTSSVTSTIQGLEQFTLAQEKAGKAGDLPAVLGAAGSSVRELSVAVTGGATQWNAYASKVIAALIAAGNGPGQIDAATKALDRQRQVLIDTVREDVARAKNAGLITAAQVNQIQSQDTLKDGTIDYGKALDDVNALIATHVTKQQAVQAVNDATSLATFQLTGAYRSLVSQLSSGAITVADFDQQLSDLSGVSAAAAKSLGDDLVKAMQKFVDTAVGALPSVGDALKDLATNVKNDQTAIGSAVKKQGTDVASAQKTLASAFKTGADSIHSAQQSLADAIKARDQAVADATNAYDAAQASHSKSVLDAQGRVAEANRRNNENIAIAQANLRKVTESDAQKILDANAKLAHDKSPQVFIDNLNAQTKLTAQFMANLQKLVAEGFAPLASELAQKGPEAAGELAKSLANDDVKAKAANSAAALSDAVTTKFHEFLLKSFDPVKNDGTQLGDSLITGMINGINSAQDRLTISVTDVALKAVNAVRSQWKISSPSLVGHDLGTQFGEGIAVGIESTSARVSDAAIRLASTSADSFRRFQASQLSPLGRSGLDITGQAGTQREDARQQQGLFRDLVVNEKADPVHIASEIAWRINT